MTREYILENLEIMCPIMFIDNPGLRDHVMSTLQDSLLIPKPKFKVGDRVTMKNNFIYDLEEERRTRRAEQIASSAALKGVKVARWRGRLEGFLVGVGLSYVKGRM